ncbi:hypothetical protein [Ligilactobacillus salivarius]|uniref:Uncharacterized protein n=1 Tax=Ligilactobacillus salivarius TaxID=1624 RepID=A0AAX3X7X0_9LACO|nr:hypothetical protein [Ligilactobacillus salivarius]WII29724.1 hypothetical protein QFE45_10680 [Ligilactobacillus salivarius]
MWLKLGRSKPKSLADELRSLSKVKQTEEKAEKKKEKAEMKELAKNEAPIMFDYLKQEFVISAKKGRDYWICNSDYFKKIMVRNSLHSDADYLYKEVKKICKRNKIRTYSIVEWDEHTTYKFYWN